MSEKWIQISDIDLERGPVTRGKSSPEPEPDRLQLPLRAGAPRNAPETLSGADDALGPAHRSGPLLRARLVMERAPHAL